MNNEIPCSSSRVTLTTKFLSLTHRIAESCLGHPKTCKFTNNWLLKNFTKITLSFVYIKECNNSKAALPSKLFTQKWTPQNI